MRPQQERSKEVGTSHSAAKVKLTYPPTMINLFCAIDMIPLHSTSKTLCSELTLNLNTSDQRERALPVKLNY